jgi:hypothetical protein
MNTRSQFPAGMPTCWLNSFAAPLTAMLNGTAFGASLPLNGPSLCHLGNMNGALKKMPMVFPNRGATSRSRSMAARLLWCSLTSVSLPHMPLTTRRILRHRGTILPMRRPMLQNPISAPGSRMSFCCPSHPALKTPVMIQRYLRKKEQRSGCARPLARPCSPSRC